MDFSSLVLIEKDKETGFIKKELGSFEVTVPEDKDKDKEDCVQSAAEGCPVQVIHTE